MHQISVYIAIRYCYVDTIVLGHILMIYGNNFKRLWFILISQTFLADYGMVWVGEKTSSDSEVYNDDSESDEEMWRPGRNMAS